MSGWRPLKGVVEDRASFPVPSFAVVHRGLLLPVRFATEEEAAAHLAALSAPVRKEAKDGPKAV